MVWSWSHTQEAYEAARTNVSTQTRDWLETVYAEWHAATRNPDADEESDCSYSEPDFDEKKYNRALKQAKRLETDILSDYIADRMEEQSLCDNGGHTAWACPYGCHTVPFDPTTDDDSDSDDDEQ